eukprot:7930915-Alexandrium_andersonii.AAC.1
MGVGLTPSCECCNAAHDCSSGPFPLQKGEQCDVPQSRACVREVFAMRVGELELTIRSHH